MSKKIIVANWKMNPKTLRDAEALLRAYRARYSAFKKVEAVICPPAVYISPLHKAVRALGARMGAQDVSCFEGGTHTGELSAAMLKSVGAAYVIIGHSERRKMGETDDVINQKILQALKSGLIPIVAVGESEKNEDADRILDMQIKAALRGISISDVRNILFVYEPRWAISRGPQDTRGLSDAPEHAIEKMIYIRRMLARLYGASVAQKTRVLYGGSVRSGIVAAFVKKGFGFNGVLVGGASLRVFEFIKLITAAADA